VLKKIDWINPHVYFYLETKDAEDKPQTYEFESVALVGMRRHNLRKEDFRIGEVVTIFAAHGERFQKAPGLDQKHQVFRRTNHPDAEERHTVILIGVGATGISQGGRVCVYHGTSRPALNDAVTTIGANVTGVQADVVTGPELIRHGARLEGSAGVCDGWGGLWPHGQEDDHALKSICASTQLFNWGSTNKIHWQFSPFDMRFELETIRQR
jgi:hypothetical protein